MKKLIALFLILLPVLATSTYEWDFNTPSDYTYNASLIEVTNGKAQLLDLIPNSKSFATYTSDINLNYGSLGVRTGTAYGGASVQGGKLNLTHNDTRYVDYAGLNNADLVQAGTIKFKYTPNYNNAPSDDRDIFGISEANGNTDNNIQIRHQSSGSLRLFLRDNTGSDINVVTLGVWNPTQLQEYEFELNFNVTQGQTRLFIDGTQFGSTQTGTGTRSSEIGLLRIGAGIIVTTNSNFLIDDFIIYPTVQHTTDYTPGYSLPETKYDTSNPTIQTDIELNEIELDYFTGFTETDSNPANTDLRYILSTDSGTTWQYWTGSAWATSNETYAQTNTDSEINTNINQLNATSNKLLLRAFLHSTYGDVRPDVDQIDIEYITNTGTYQTVDTDENFIIINLPEEQHIYQPYTVEVKYINGSTAIAGANCHITTYNNWEVVERFNPIEPKDPTANIEKSLLSISETDKEIYEGRLITQDNGIIHYAFELDNQYQVGNIYQIRVECGTDGYAIREFEVLPGMPPTIIFNSMLWLKENAMIFVFALLAGVLFFVFILPNILMALGII